MYIHYIRKIHIKKRAAVEMHELEVERERERKKTAPNERKM